MVCLNKLIITTYLKDITLVLNKGIFSFFVTVLLLKLSCQQIWYIMPMLLMLSGLVLLMMMEKVHAETSLSWFSQSPQTILKHQTRSAKTGRPPQAGLRCFFSVLYSIWFSLKILWTGIQMEKRSMSNAAVSHCKAGLKIQRYIGACFNQNSNCHN